MAKYSTRPNIKIPRGRGEIFVEALAVLGVLVCAALPGVFWAQLPALVPQHFGISGRPDAWAGKRFVFFLPVLCLVLYLGLSLVGRYPRTYNYPWPITEENAPRQYALARAFIRWLKLEVVWLFAFLEWNIISVAVYGRHYLTSWVLAGTLLVLFGTLGVYIYRAYRVR